MSAIDTVTGSVLGGATASGGDANSAASGGGFDLGGLLGGLGSLFSGSQASNQASQLQTIIDNAYSFNGSRPQYVTQLNNLMSNPEQAVTSSPGYQAQLDQALQATQRTGASQGLTVGYGSGRNCEHWGSDGAEHL